MDDTIVAVASAPGGAARGIVRLSGPAALRCADEVFRGDGGSESLPKEYAVAVEGEVLPHGWHTPAPATLLAWPEGRSYTGQAMVEFHMLGSPPLLGSLVHALCRCGARLAAPGEFTMRAFLAGRLDLAQAEAVLGAIEAENPEQLNAALAQLAGGLSSPLAALREELLELLAHLEAGFEFAEEDIETLPPKQRADGLARASAVLADLQRRMRQRAETGRAAAVLLGLPNTGKSSLFNALAGGRALVDARPGTTRDYLCAEIDLEGVGCRLIDTAGRMPEGAHGPLAAAADRLAAREGIAAPVALLCLDATRPLRDWEREQLDRLPRTRRLIVLTKCDRPRTTDYSGDAVETSARSGLGLDGLRAAVREAIGREQAAAGDVVAGTAARCRESVDLAATAIARANAIVAAQEGEELLAAELRLALDELGKLVGTVYTDDVLDRVFSRFCVGK